MRVRVGLVGAGYFAGFHAEAWQRLDGSELVGVCDLDLAAAEKFSNGTPVFDQCEAMIREQKPDLLDIATPPSTHRELIELAIAHGIPVVCQKPVAPSSDEARAIAELVRENEHLVIIHENFRFQPWYREIKRLLDENFVGQIYGISFRMRPGDGQGADAYMARQPYFQKMQRFLIHETAIHWIDSFRYLLGEVESVSAHIRKLNPVIAGEDAAIINLNFQNQAVGVFDGNRLARHEARNPRLTMGEMWLDGSLGSIRLDGNGSLWLKSQDEPERIHSYAWQDRGFGGDCVASLQAHILDHLLHGNGIENRIEDYMRNIEIEDAIYLAADEGRWVKV